MLQFAFYFHLLGNTVLQLLVFAQILDAFILIVRSQLIAHLPKTLFDIQKISFNFSETILSEVEYKSYGTSFLLFFRRFGDV